MTIKESIIRYLEEQGGLQFSGKVCRAVAEIHLCKESNVERRCRELEVEGKLERQLADNPSGGNKVVLYRINPMQKFSNLGHDRPDFLKAKLISDSQKSLL
mgnify:CR=1 FL=1